MTRDELGQAIRKERRRQRLGAPELARRAGLSPGTIYRAEKGTVDTEIENLRLILRALGMPEELLPEEDGHRPSRQAELQAMVNEIALNVLEALERLERIEEALEPAGTRRTNRRR